VLEAGLQASPILQKISGAESDQEIRYERARPFLPQSRRADFFRSLRRMLAGVAILAICARGYR
jgi:hypothetical protein